MLMKMTKPCLCSISGGTTLRIDCPRHGAYSIVWCKVCKSSVRYESHDSEHFKMSSLIPSPTTMKHLFKTFEGICSKCGVNRSNKELPCQPSEEKECCICAKEAGRPYRAGEDYCDYHAPTEAGWEEELFERTRHLTPVTYGGYTQLKSFITQLLKKEREKVIEEIDSWLKKDSEGTWELEGLYMRFKDYLRKLKK